MFSGTVGRIIVHTVVDFLVVVLSGEGNKVFCALYHTIIIYGEWQMEKFVVSQ